MAATVDSSDLLLLIRAELEQANAKLAVAATRYPKMRLSNVKVRLGQGPGEAAGARYTGDLDGKGWEFEASFEIGKITPPEPLLGDMLSLFRVNPIEALRGVGPDLGGALNSEGILTIGDIADVSEETLSALSHEGSIGLEAVRLHTQTHMLKMNLPRGLPASSLDDMSVHELLFMKSTEIHQAIGPMIAQSKAREVRGVLHLLHMSLHESPLGSTKFGTLRAL